MEKLNIIRDIMSRYAAHSGADPHRGHSMVIDVAGAHALLREVFFGRLPRGVVVTAEPDELVSIDGVSVKLRYALPYGHAFIMPMHEVLTRTCCDASAQATLLTCLARGANA